jgi:hypothetical protein
VRKYLIVSPSELGNYLIADTDAWNDFYKVRAACQSAELGLGLRETAPADRTAARRPTRAETELSTPGRVLVNVATRADFRRLAARRIAPLVPGLSERAGGGC